jgi:hypothetical protein
VLLLVLILLVVLLLMLVVLLLVLPHRLQLEVQLNPISIPPTPVRTPTPVVQAKFLRLHIFLLP